LAELWFYQLGQRELARALPPLLERCLAKGWRALVRGTDRGRLEALDQALWAYSPESFLPHGLDSQDGQDDPVRNPIWLSHQMANANGAEVVFLIDGALAPDAAQFQRVCEVFDGEDPAALAAARAHWREGKSLGLALAYWREKQGIGWAKEA
jgi:DNA polymerase III subunit chi